MATHKRCFPCLVILLLCSCLFIHISEFDPLKMMQRNFLFNIIFFSIRSECISKCLKRRWMCWKKLYSLLSNEWSMFYSLLLHWGILLKKNSPSSLSFEECDKAKFFKKSFENNPCFFFLLQISCIFYSYFFFISFSFISWPPDTFDSKWLFFCSSHTHTVQTIFFEFLYFFLSWAQNDFWETRKRIFYEYWPVLSIVLYSIWPSMILITFHMHLQMRVKIYMLILLGNYFSFFLSFFFLRLETHIIKKI